MSSKETRKLCDVFRKRLRTSLCCSGSARMAITFLALLSLFLFLDWWLHLGPVIRLALLLIFLGALGSVAWFTMLLPLRRKWSDRHILSYMDSVLPEEDAVALEYYELMDQEGIQEVESEVGRSLTERAKENVRPLVQKAEKVGFLHLRSVKRWSVGAAVLALVFIAVAIPLQHYLLVGVTRFFNPFSMARWPHKTTITLQAPETGWTIPQFESLTVNAELSGVVPPDATLAYKGESAGYWIKEKLNVGEDDTVEYVFEEVGEPLEFYIEGGDFKTFPQKIDIIQRPYIKDITVQYDFPTYAGIPNKKERGGEIYGLEGTTVRMEFSMSMALDKALFIMEEEEPEALEKKNDTLFEKTMILEKDGVYKIQLYEKNGFREARPEEYNIRVIPDNPPEVQMLDPGRDIVATRRASIDIQFEASDDFGLDRVAFVYQVAGKKEKVLSDKITGPIPQSGRSSRGKFTWNLKDAELPESGLLTYHVAVQDINPTGRGKVKSSEYRVNLLKPSEFHRRAIEQTKRLETEARIAWENQLAAWDAAGEWKEKGTGKEDDELWLELNDRQGMAIRAARAVRMQLADLTEKYTRNDMSKEFMSVRLGGIKDAINHVTSEIHPSIDRAVKGTRPQTAADSIEGKLKQTRESAVSKFMDEQKRAVLYMEQMLKNLFDWRDLQVTVVRSTLLHEEQQQVMKETEEVAPNFIGLEIEDISDEDQDLLLTLGKRQQTIFDVETELENQLTYLKFKAGKQNRGTIQRPLETAYKVLRDRRVNDNLKKSAQMIRNNQPYQIIRNQKDALRALDIVKGGLIMAGQKVEPDPEIKLAMTPNRDLGEIEVGTEAEMARTEPEKDEEDAEEVEGRAAQMPSAEELLAALPTGSDVLSQAMNIAYELQDSVHARTEYLSKNSSEKEMPRYVRLKKGIIGRYQSSAIEALDRAIKSAKEKEESDFVPVALGLVRQEFLQSDKLVDNGVYESGVQQLQADSIETIKDLMQYLSLREMVDNMAAENRKRKGEDPFGRKYLFRDDDLDNAVEIIEKVGEARILQRDILKTVSRFVEHKTDNKLLESMEKSNRERAAKVVAFVRSRVGDAGKRMEKFSEDVAARVQATVGKRLKEIELREDVGSKKIEKEDVDSMRENAELMAASIQNFRRLLEERVAPPEEVIVAEAEPEQISAEEFMEQRSAENMLELAKKDERLPEDVRRIMISSLEKGFSEEYRDLLSSYFYAVLKEEE